MCLIELLGLSTLDISKAFDRIWHAGLLHKHKSYGISGQIFELISSFLSNRRLRVVLDGKSQGSILGPTLFLITSMTFLMMLSVILLSILMRLLSTLNVIRYLICSNTVDETLWTGAGGGLLILMLEKFN